MQPNVNDKKRDEQAKAERAALVARLDKLIEQAQTSQARHPQSYIRLQSPLSKAKSRPDLQAAGEGWPEAEPDGNWLFDLALVGVAALLALRWLLGRRRG